MIGDSNFDQLLRSFQDQFELTRDGKWVYRKSQRGPPISVTPDECERFVDDYLRRIRIAYWGGIALVLAFAGLVIWWTVITHSKVPMVTLIAGVIAILVAFVGYSIRARRAPARELANRAPLGRERTSDEMRALFLERTSYGQLAGAAFVGVAIVLSQAFKEDLLSGWHRLWLVAAAAMILLTAVQAFRKWRFERDGR